MFHWARLNVPLTPPAEEKPPPTYSTPRAASTASASTSPPDTPLPRALNVEDAMSHWASLLVPLTPPMYSVLWPDTSLVVNATLAETSDARPSSASAMNPVCVAALPKPAPSVRVTATDAPPASVAPEEGVAVIHDVEATAVHATAVDARLVTVTVAEAVVPSAQESLTAAGDTASGGDTVNTSGTTSSSPPATPTTSVAEWSPLARPVAFARTVTEATEAGARALPELALVKLSHGTEP
mmetsp:Transcript_27008/g.66214  ORF Transcript_27008/g.66214 Transcript_27008/m.66214 type:complete len:240 (-) Transcript_27008:22-741(-)